MLVTVIIFLREVLEAALILSILLSVTFQMKLSRTWILPALGIGFIGASVTAYYLGDISSLFEGTGQEVMNSILLIVMVLLINIICIWLSQFIFNPSNSLSVISTNTVRWVLIFNVGLAIMHEGSEISIYSYSFIQTHQNNLSLILGGGLGLGIGVSLGAIVYYLLINLQQRVLFKVVICALLLISSGMASQAALYLIQAGWLPSQLPLWDTSNIISERSIVGQLLYALIGYEATPSPLQVSCYFAVIIICIVSILAVTRLNRMNKTQ